MRYLGLALFSSLAITAFMAGALARADDLPTAPEAIPDSQAPQAKPDGPAPQAKKDVPPEKTPAAERAELYTRLADATDADETSGIITRLLHNYSESGSDTADLLLKRARQAIGVENYSDALKILDATVALQPEWAEGWNARATARFLDDNYKGSMADIAQTLKREPKHLGALMGMGMILEAREKREEALKVYERVLEIAPHWRNAQEAADKLKAALAGNEL
jgi:tetratricopeptide (TPR) repeat protein